MQENHSDKYWNFEDCIYIHKVVNTDTWVNADQFTCENNLYPNKYNEEERWQTWAITTWAGPNTWKIYKDFCKRIFLQFLDPSLIQLTPSLKYSILQHGNLDCTPQWLLTDFLAMFLCPLIPLSETPIPWSRHLEIPQLFF